MNNLIQFQNKPLTIDSRDVAKMVGKEHDKLLRDIRTYISQMEQANEESPRLESPIKPEDYFIESIYVNSQNKNQPCYLLTKLGCEFVSNKLTGVKGTAFTAIYTKKFNEMESQQQKPTCIEDVLIQSLQEMKDIRLKVEQTSNQVQVVAHRINSLDCTNIDGTPQQRLNSMVRKYSYDNGIIYSQGWKDFRKAFNTAYQTNVVSKCKNYCEAHHIKNLSIPAYLSRVGLIEDALRVADKMLNIKEAAI